MNEEAKKREISNKMLEISDEILDIVDNRDDFDRGDLQGAIEAQVMKAIRFGREVEL